MQSAIGSLRFTLTDNLAYCKPGCHSLKAIPAPQMTLMKDLKAFPIPIGSRILRYKNPSVLHISLHVMFCIHPDIVNL